MSTIFPGMSFPSTVFPQFIDMSSTQALVTLVSECNFFITNSIQRNFSQIFLYFVQQARAAKEAEIQQILKGPPKRLNKSQHTPPNSQNPLRQQQSPTSNPTTSPQNRLSNVPTALQYMSFQQKASSLINQTLSGSTNQTVTSNENRNRTASPLDLSATTPVSKRLKMESPSPNRSLGSPTTMAPAPSQIQQQNSTRNRTNTPSTVTNTSASSTTITTNTSSQQRRCHAQSDEINSWSVNQVCDFVGSIDICAEYVEVSPNDFFIIQKIPAKNNCFLFSRIVFNVCLFYIKL